MATKKEVVEDVWTEKYRPLTLDEVSGQELIVKSLKSFVKNKSLQHLLFVGPAGTGKTTCAIAVARELFGENWRQNILELNASDERGIDVIRNKVKTFARTKAFGDVPFKLIYLDESDALTQEAQQALRRTMEDYTGTCRFVLSANYGSKIISPIQSRCALFRFAPLTEKDVGERLKMIAKKENIHLEQGGEKAILEIAKGDLRTAINLLQASASTANKISEDEVYNVSSKAKPKQIQEVVELALSGKFVDARSRLNTIMIEQGLAGEEVIRQVHSIVMNTNLGISEEKLTELIDKIGEYDFRVIEGSDDRIQLDALLAQIYLIGKKK
ncbi:TPA: replication factor C small subunit [archaeon]|uniref:Replication factor C small subunit n=1 Tax=Candidatus Naiadarchaeum limnaeum TaxID=2756139 RepID=A0A832XHZ3_9ARCH|nr:replication factor C small subunit [Candidatus Naiadarchaeum limnaeum]